MKYRLQLSRGNNGSLAVRKRSLIEWMVLIVAFWSFLFEPANLLPGTLSYLKYLPDGILLALIILTLFGGRISVQRKLLLPAILAFLFFLYTLIVYLFRYQSVAYYLWGFRNNFRFIVAFFAFVSIVDEVDAKTWIRWIDILFWINIPVTLFQFIVLGLRGDYLGGIFGVAKGVNADSIVLISLVLGRSFLMTFHGEEKMWLCVLKSACSMFVAAAAELKFLFLIFIMLLIGASMLTRYSWRKMLLWCLAAVILIIGVSFAVSLFDYVEGFTLKRLWTLATQDNYSSGEDVNRLSAISTLSKNIVKNPVEQLFGLGLGNCDTSAFAACNTPFYKQYSYLHYTWVMVAMLFLETGYVGLTIYFLFLISCGWCTYKQYKRGQGNRVDNQTAFLMTALCMALIFYNASLRVETAYTIYFILAIPFINTKPKKGTLITPSEENVREDV